MNNKKKLFIDCGGFNGSSVRKFLNEVDNPSEYNLVTFEPNPTFYRCYSNFGNNHTLIPAAVWTREGELEFYLDEIDGDGSSVLKEKTTGQLNKTFPLRVPSIDFSNWLKENVNNNEEVYLKLDIEGAEYEVLDKMFTDGTINLIKELFIEWHWDKIPSITKERHSALVERLASIGIVPSLWDANTREYINE